MYSFPCPSVCKEYYSNRVLCTLCPVRGCARSTITIGFCVYSLPFLISLDNLLSSTPGVSGTHILLVFRLL